MKVDNNDSSVVKSFIQIVSPRSHCETRLLTTDFHSVTVATTHVDEQTNQKMTWNMFTGIKF